MKKLKYTTRKKKLWESKNDRKIVEPQEQANCRKSNKDKKTLKYISRTRKFLKILQGQEHFYRYIKVNCRNQTEEREL